MPNATDETKAAKVDEVALVVGALTTQEIGKVRIHPNFHSTTEQAQVTLDALTSGAVTADDIQARGALSSS